jgi:Tol biopolymer transport system component
MGEVYRAKDTKLGRDVAIKVLPEVFVRDPERLSRFEREARLLASLDHPNIGAIYELQEQDGVQFIVMQLVEGETLGQRLVRGPLAVDEAFPIFAQIAEALEAAHEQGIKLGHLPDAVTRPMTTPPGLRTSDDVILGTPSYMSPEQARGKPVDKRTDIWAFGCCLYEALTGKLPFEGETVSDALAAVLERNPNWEALPDTTPPNIRVLLRRCLEKDASCRLQDVGDARIEIQETLTQPSIAPPVVPLQSRVAGPVRWKGIVLVGLVGLIVGVIGATLWQWHLQRPSHVPSQPVKRLTIVSPSDFGPEALFFHALAFSPDGRRLAFVGEDSEGRKLIYLRDMGQLEARALAGTEGGITPFFSPDGESLAFVDHTSKTLKRMFLRGGRPVVLCGGEDIHGGTWTVDNTIVYTPDWDSGLMRINASGGEPQVLTTLGPDTGETNHNWPQVLPDGKTVIFTSHVDSDSGSSRNIEAVSLETGERRLLMKDGTYARYVPTGCLVFVREGTLYGVPFDLTQLKVTGRPVPILEGVRTGTAGISGSAQYTVSADGSLAYLPAVTSERRLVWVNRQGQREPLAAPLRNFQGVRISPNGERLALTIAEVTESDVWIYELERGGALSKLTFDGDSRRGIWTPDGQRVTFAIRAPEGSIAWKRADGSGESEVISQVGEPYAWSPDGKHLLVWIYGKLTKPDIWVLPMEAKEAPEPFIERAQNQRHATFSPDGQWVAYSAEDSGRWEVYVEPFPGPGPKIQVSTEGGYEPVWSRDGHEVFFFNKRYGDKMKTVSVETKEGFKATAAPEELFEIPDRAPLDFLSYDVGEDGRFIVTLEEQESAANRINVVLNFSEELKRLVPTGGQEKD